MALRRAYWINDAMVDLDNAVFVVGYKHHLDRISVNPGEVATFYQYRACDDKDGPPGSAWEWGEDFKLRIRRSGKIVIANPNTESGMLLDAHCVDCGGGDLLIELKVTPFELIKIGVDPTRKMRGWSPEGYADAEHLRNHPQIRRA